MCYCLSHVTMYGCTCAYACYTIMTPLLESIDHLKIYNSTIYSVHVLALCWQGQMAYQGIFGRGL